MKRIVSSMILLALAFCSFAQNTINDPNAEKRNVSGFHAIEVGGGIDLYLSQGAEAVAVSASEPKYRDKIKTEVVNGVLKIYFEYEKGVKISWNSNNRKLKAYVAAKELDGLSAGGGCDVVVNGLLKSASGGSDITITATKELNVESSGGSDVHYKGSAVIRNIKSSGGGTVKKASK